MIDLAIPREPWWLDLPGGVRVHVRPLTTALMLAARQRLRQKDGEHEDAGEAMDEAARIEALVKGNRPVGAAHAAWAACCEAGVQFQGSSSSRRVTMWSLIRARTSAR